MAGVWTAHPSPSGQPYYFNMKTGVSAWTPSSGPQIGDAHPEAASADSSMAPAVFVPAPAPAPLPTVKRGPAKVSLKVPMSRSTVIATVGPADEPAPVAPVAKPQLAAAPQLARPAAPARAGPVDRRAEYARIVERLSAKESEDGNGAKFFVK